MNRLSREKRAQIIAMLCEGMSMRAVARVADVSRNTVDKLLQNAGSAALDYQDQMMVNLPCRRVQCDEIWSFVYAKEKNAPRATAPPEWAGDVWTWVAICADTKIVPCWHVGARDGGHAFDFMADLRPRLANVDDLGAASDSDRQVITVRGCAGLLAGCDLTPTPERRHHRRPR